jgi:hypothetical protein
MGLDIDRYFRQKKEMEEEVYLKKLARKQARTEVSKQYFSALDTRRQAFEERKQSLMESQAKKSGMSQAARSFFYSKEEIARRGKANLLRTGQDIGVGIASRAGNLIDIRTPKVSKAGKSGLFNREKFGRG